MKRAVITGMGLVSPLGNNVPETLVSLKDSAPIDFLVDCLNPVLTLKVLVRVSLALMVSARQPAPVHLAVP